MQGGGTCLEVGVSQVRPDEARPLAEAPKHVGPLQIGVIEDGAAEDALVEFLAGEVLPGEVLEGGLLELACFLLVKFDGLREMASSLAREKKPNSDRKTTPGPHLLLRRRRTRVPRASPGPGPPRRGRRTRRGRCSRREVRAKTKATKNSMTRTRTSPRPWGRPREPRRRSIAVRETPAVFVRRADWRMKGYGR